MTEAPDRDHRGRSWPVVLVLLVIGRATLLPAPPVQMALPMFCLVCGTLGGVDVTLNTLLFMPLGAALAWRRPGVWRAVLLCFVVSLTIESLQFRFIPGRDASLSDLLTNTLGGFLGALAVQQAARWLAPAAREARRLLVVVVALWIGTLALTAALLHPWIRYRDYYGQWAPDQARYAPFTGRVLSVSVNGDPMPYNVVPHRDRYISALRSGHTVIRVRMVSGRPTSGLSAIARLTVADLEPFIIAQWGRDVVFRTPLRASAARLRPPAIRLSDALPDANEAVLIDAGLDGPAWYVQVARHAGTVERRVPFSVALGWAFLLPLDLPLGTWYPAVDAVWLALLAMPLGFFAHHAAAPRQRRGWLLLAVAAVATGVGCIPWLAGFQAAPWSEWLGALAGLGLGWGARTPARRLFQPRRVEEGAG
jgi:VanZ like family